MDTVQHNFTVHFPDFHFSTPSHIYICNFPLLKSFQHQNSVRIPWRTRQGICADYRSLIYLGILATLDHQAG
jgi:hypothetical protein